MSDEEDDVRPEVYAAMDGLYKSNDPAVKTVLEVAEQRGYTDFDKFVMLAQSLHNENELLRQQLVGMLLTRPKEFVILTQDEFDAITSINRKGK